MTKRIKPLHNLVLLWPEPIPAQTPTGLHLPQGANSDTETRDGRTYRVLAVGPGLKRKNCIVPPDLQPGDRVWLDKFSKYYPTEVEDGLSLIDARGVAMVLGDLPSK